MESFRDWLEAFANKVREADAIYSRAMGGRLSVVILTSDAMISKIRYTVGEKIDWAFIRPIDHLRAEDDRELLWRLIGGTQGQ